MIGSKVMEIIKKRWDENILSKRVIAWISNADLLLDKKEDKFLNFLQPI